MPLSPTLHPLAFAWLVIIIITSPFTNAEKCSDEFLFEIRNRNITQHCSKKTLGIEFGWNFDNGTRWLEIAFGGKLATDSGWLAWGLNLHGPLMVGTQALIGVKQTNNAPLRWNKYIINGTVKYGCPLSPSNDIGLDVRNFSFVHLEKMDYYMIRANVFLPYEFNSSRTNVVWQVGEVVGEGVPLMHSKSLNHLDTAETIDFINGKVKSRTAHERRRIRTAHGALNVVGWGTLLPTGVITARYFRRYPFQWDWWYLFHVSCQSLGYVLGTTGWALGLWLGDASKYYCFQTHRILAIIIVTSATIQMVALRLKPGSSDEYRSYWNMYHHSLGYALLAAIVVNIFQGIKIFEPIYVWKWAYIGVLGVLGGVALALEIYTWIKFCLQRQSMKLKPTDEGNKPRISDGQTQNIPIVGDGEGNKPSISNDQTQNIPIVGGGEGNKPSISNDQTQNIPLLGGGGRSATESEIKIV